jgi:hypothetical protein
MLLTLQASAAPLLLRPETKYIRAHTVVAPSYGALSNALRAYFREWRDGRWPFFNGKMTRAKIQVHFS